MGDAPSPSPTIDPEPESEPDPDHNPDPEPDPDPDPDADPAPDPAPKPTYEADAEGESGGGDPRRARDDEATSAAIGGASTDRILATLCARRIEPTAPTEAEADGDAGAVRVRNPLGADDDDDEAEAEAEAEAGPAADVLRKSGTRKWAGARPSVCMRSRIGRSCAARIGRAASSSTSGSPQCTYMVSSAATAASRTSLARSLSACVRVGACACAVGRISDWGTQNKTANDGRGELYVPCLYKNSQKMLLTLDPNFDGGGNE